jgi:hypothetical protein
VTVDDTVNQTPLRTLRVPDIPLGFDITDLMIYEEEKRKEQQRQDEQFRQVPLYAPQPMPYRRPEPPKKNERGVEIIPMY